MEEIRLKKPEIDDMRIENRVQLTKVYVGSGNDYIVVSGNDISIFERFKNAGNELEKLADELELKDAEIRKKYDGKENSEIDSADREKIIGIKKEFSQEAEKIMDGVFGEGTTKKFFGDVYAVIPTFQPDLECFLDFWDKLIPVIERLSEHKIKLEKLASKKRMSKYQPQDHKRKGAK